MQAKKRSAARTRHLTLPLELYFVSTLGGDIWWTGGTDLLVQSLFAGWLYNILQPAPTETLSGTSGTWICHIFGIQHAE